MLLPVVQEEFRLLLSHLWGSISPFPDTHMLAFIHKRIEPFWADCATWRLCSSNTEDGWLDGWMASYH